MSRFVSLPLFEHAADEQAALPKRRGERPPPAPEKSGTFTDNMKLPVHRWFRYSAGFSASWAENLVSTQQRDSVFTVLDPFAGSGTTLIAAERVGAKAIGFESHPFVARIAQAKLAWRMVDAGRLRREASALTHEAKKQPVVGLKEIPPLLQKCYSITSLEKLFSLRDAFCKTQARASAEKLLLWLAVTAILRPCSCVGTAQWQYVLPNKKKLNPHDPFEAFELKIEEIISDIGQARRWGSENPAKLLVYDARDKSPLSPDSVDLVITSPPYPNNYDYADATRLEMTFWEEIGSWGDLQESVRKHLVRSCSQHTAAQRLQLEELLAMEVLAPIVDELAPVCQTLGEVRLTRGGKKTYHTMIAAYFADLARVLHSLRPVCKRGSRLCLVIGDSAPYGVHVPAEKWLTQLAIESGFERGVFEKIRDRNIKWKNRKHRVPLHEGRLWIKG